MTRTNLRVVAAAWRLGVLLILLALAPYASAGVKPPQCTPPSSGSLQNVVVVLVDVSQSTDSAAIRRSYSGDFTQRIEYALGEKGGALFGQSTYLVVGAIDQRDSTDFNPLQCTYPHEGSSTNPLVFEMQVKAFNDQVDRAVGKLINGPRETQGTTLLDALTAVSNLVHGLRAQHRYLVIFSDMIEYSRRMKMTSATRLDASSTARFIGRQRAAGDLPQLAGYEVYVAGPGGTVEDPSRQPDPDNVRAFWTTYFKATGASLQRSNYNGRLTRFP